jgi:hypothetical protein
MALTEIVALFHNIIVCSVLIFVTQNLEWDKADLAHVAASRVTSLSTFHLAMFRLLCALLIWGSLACVAFTRTPLYLTVNRKGIKEMVALVHLERFSMFTVWCWTLKVRFLF